MAGQWNGTTLLAAPRIRRLLPVSLGVLAASLILAFALAPAVTNAASDPYPFLGAFGDSGSGAFAEGGDFSNPQGVAVAPDGSVWVVDKGNQRIQKFTPYGEFQFTIGRDVITDGTPSDPGAETGFQKCEVAAHCRGGVNLGAGTWTGANAGFANPQGITVDGGGDVYVTEQGGRRVSKYDSDGTFLFAWGADVNKSIAGTDAEICTAASGDTCGQGLSQTSTTDAGEFNNWPTNGDFIEADGTGNIWVADRNRVQGFGTDGGPIASTVLAGGGQPVALAVATSGDVLASYQSLDGVRRINPSGAVMDVFGTSVNVASLAQGPTDVFLGEQKKITPFNESGDAGQEFGGMELDTLRGLATSVDGTVYATDAGLNVRVMAFGPTPSQGTPPPVAADVDANPQHVTSTSARIEARINPRFQVTNYSLEYGTSGPCSANPCDSTPEREFAFTGNISVSEQIELDGLASGTEYHYRLVANNATGPSSGPDRTFRTFAPPTSFELPDDRVWELVSPADKSHADALTPADSTQVSVDGDRLAYASVGSFGDPDGANPVNQYIAQRGPDGWESMNLVPTQPGAAVTLFTATDRFTPDLRHSALKAWGSGISPEEVANVPNVYLRSLDSLEDYTVVTRDEGGTIFAPDTGLPFVGALKSDGSSVVFESPYQHLPGAAHGSKNLYHFERTTQELSLVGILPGESPAPQGSVLGSGADEASSTRDMGSAASADFDRIFFTTPAGSGGLSSGDIYLRENHASSVHVNSSELAAPEAPQPATFLMGADDASVAFFRTREPLVEGDGPAGGPGTIDLYRYVHSENPETDENLTLVSEDLAPLDESGVEGVIGVSENGHRVYFSARRELVSGQPPAPHNHKGIYLWEDGAGVEFLGWVPSSEIDTAIERQPDTSTAQVASDGSHLTIVSAAPLDGGQNAGRSQVYVYDADESALSQAWQCASCPASGAIPRHDADLWGRGTAGFSAPLGAFPRTFSADGERLFFQTADQLSVHDENDAVDVYQFDTATGDVDLLSSGMGSGAEFIGASENGDSVFFGTREQLVGWDEDNHVDIYVARVNGGLPNPSAELPPCSGAECQGPQSEPPPAEKPGSNGYIGTGNSGEAAERPSNCRGLATKVKQKRARIQRLRKRARKAALDRPAKARSIRKKVRRVARRTGRAEDRLQICKGEK